MQSYATYTWPWQDPNSVWSPPWMRQAATYQQPPPQHQASYGYGGANHYGTCDPTPPKSDISLTMASIDARLDQIKAILDRMDSRRPLPVVGTQDTLVGLAHVAAPEHEEESELPASEVNNTAQPLQAQEHVEEPSQTTSDETSHGYHNSSSAVHEPQNSPIQDDKFENLEDTFIIVTPLTPSKMRASSLSFWLNAYSNVFGGCRKIPSAQDMKDRLTWDLSDYFQKHSGRPPFPHCDRNFPTKNCLQRLDDDAHKVFLQFFLQIDSICHQLQVHAFKHQTERLVNELKKSAEYAEDKLNSIEEKGEILLQNSKHIHGALSSIDEKTQQVAETSRNLEESVNSVKIYSEEIHERSKGIASAQEELIRGQSKMRERMDEGMEIVRDSYSNLGAEISSLKDEAAEIEREIEQVGEAMFLRMDGLRMKADDIQNLTGNSLDNQKKLLEVQTASLEGLRLLASFQSQALQESR